ncbi:MAG: class I SAM-dependent methyltransferase [Promethearchaeota archaeon]
MIKNNPFNNRDIAQNYDSFYNEKIGQAYDILEKDAIINIIEKIFIESNKDRNERAFDVYEYRHKNDKYSFEQNNKIELIFQNVTKHRLKLLEIGCGTAHWSIFFRRLGFDVIGIDISKAMLEIAQKKITAFGMDKIKCLNCDIFHLEDYISKILEEEREIHIKFDIIAFITSLEFMENPRSTLSRAIYYLKEGGYIIAAVLNADSYLGKKRKQNSIKIQNKGNSKSDDKVNIYENAFFFTANELKTLLVNSMIDFKTKFNSNIKSKNNILQLNNKKKQIGMNKKAKLIPQLQPYIVQCAYPLPSELENLSTIEEIRNIERLKKKLGNIHGNMIIGVIKNEY